MDRAPETKTAHHPAPPTVAFVCLHGPAKSVLAAACFVALYAACRARVGAKPVDR